MYVNCIVTQSNAGNKLHTKQTNKKEKKNTHTQYLDLIGHILCALISSYQTGGTLEHLRLVK
jgi:hypothetical protein